MDGQVASQSPASDAVAIALPPGRRLPVVVASPHSGREYPPSFLAAARLDPHTLRRSEDGFVDEIFGRVPERGVPLLRALFPRAFLDVNREAYELDPEMFDDALPGWVNTRSPRVVAGLGTIARIVAQGKDIYRGKLRFAEAVERVERYYTPYHAALRRLVDETRAAFGHAILIDAHSMPSQGASRTPGGRAVDVVLGDCYGSSCAATVTEAAEQWLAGRGYVVTRNTPYAGGFTTRHYGRPRAGIHALQIELNRALYMDEATLSPSRSLERLTADMTDFVAALGAIGPETLSG
ncbi:N-formylglutamate amidohydrolase [Inquilinus limosus]|uniref:N-formylglutamate amidohydrolase n=1 Tax=Inquilinus limosus TaxID=171674 RepID=UPI003F15742D